MPGELCRYTVTTNILDEDEEVDIVKTARVPSRITNTSKSYVHCKVVLPDNYHSSSVRSLQI